MVGERRTAKDDLYGALAAPAAALGHAHRAEIVDLLTQGTRTVSTIAGEIGQSVATTSHHLRRLHDAGLVHSERVGRHVRYGLADDGVADLWMTLREMAGRLTPGTDRRVAEYLGERHEVECVTAAELRDRLDAGRVVLIDVRPTAEFDAGHIAGARSLPVDELAGSAATLPAGVEIIAYCRGPYCVYADDAVRLLHRQGRAARRLDVGYPDWRRAGLPVAVGA